jgi:hypothetical protein
MEKNNIPTTNNLQFPILSHSNDTSGLNLSNSYSQGKKRFLIGRKMMNLFTFFIDSYVDGNDFQLSLSNETFLVMSFFRN